MPRVIFSHAEGDAFIHQFRNFGEDVWRVFRDDKRIDVSLDEIDRCTDRFEVSAKRAFLRRVIQRTQPILKRQFMEDRVVVSVEE